MFNGADGGASFPDTGSAGSVWTRSSSNVTTSTGTVKEGDASLLITNSADFLSTPYTSANRIGNTGEDFFIGGWFRPNTNNINQEIVGVEGSPGTAANTAFLIFLPSTNGVQFYYSDGSTLPHITDFAVGWDAGVWHYISVYLQRSTDEVFLQVDGTASTGNAFIGNLNLPVGQNLKFGASPADPGPATGNWDMWQFRRSIPSGIPGGGASFTPPTTPWGA
jgi:hypothetical protein